jgi:hypothetical protein
MIKPLSVTFDLSVAFLMVIKYHITLSLKYSKIARVNVYFMNTVD